MIWRSTCAAPVLASLLLLLAGAGCTYGHQEDPTGAYQPLVFPGEARLGASAFMVIDSNKIQTGDHLERYDLHRGRVQVLVEGNRATVAANLRSVFAVESGRATIDAEARPNAWVMVAFFDLPDASAEAFTATYPQHARLHLKVDDTEVPDLEGVIWIVGDGGEPTSMNATPLLPLLESELQPRTMVRLRARGGGAEGFQSSWQIGSLRAEIHYDPACLESPSAHAGSEAVGGGLTLGPPLMTQSPYPGGLHSAQLVLTYPKGFYLPVASGVDATRLGSGPILDIAFDRKSGCPLGLESYFWVRSLEVRDVDGTLRVARPAAGEDPTTFDASSVFHFHYVDPDGPA